MQKQRIVSGLFCLLFSCYTFADNPVSEEPLSKPVNNSSTVPNLYAIYSYNDFKYNASTATQLSKFQGHSNLYLAGENNIRITDSLSTGLFIYRLDTDLKLKFSPLSATSQVIHNNNLFAHLLKNIHSDFYVDLTAGVGQSAINSATTTVNIDEQPQGFAKSHSSNWFANISGLYSHSWNNFLFNGNIGFLYSAVNQNEFTYFYQAPFPVSAIPAIKSNASLLLENVEIDYTAHTNIQPFVTGGLIQVLNYSNGRILAEALAVGSGPQVNLNKDGYEVGVGLALKYKRYSLRLEQQYYQRGSVYYSNQTIASLRVNLG